MQQSSSLRGLVQSLLSKDAGSLGAMLVRRATGSLGLKIANSGLTFVLAVLLARVLGAAEYGVYTYTMSWIRLLIIFAILGQGRLLTRNMAIYLGDSDWGRMRGLLTWTNRATLIASVLIALVAGTVAFFLVQDNPALLTALLVAFLLLPLLALTRLRQAALTGMHHIVTGQIPDLLVQPLLFIMLVSAIAFLSAIELTAIGALWLNVIATAVAFLLGAGLLFQRIPDGTRATTPVYDGRAWILAAIPLLLADATHVINSRVDSIMLGTLQGTAEVGIYSAATRGAELITFGLIAVNTTLAPTIASLYARGETQRLQRILTNGARAVLLFSVLVGAALILFGQWFLALFGPEFVAGYSALVILSVGRIINASTGSVANVLVMTGHERTVALGVGLGSVLNIILNLTLIPRYGLNGAAIATASSMILWNLVLVVVAKRTVGLNTTAFRFRRRRAKGN